MKYAWMLCLLPLVFLATTAASPAPLAAGYAKPAWVTLDFTHATGTNLKDKHVSVDWPPVSGAKGYRWHREIKKGGAWVSTGKWNDVPATKTDLDHVIEVFKGGSKTIRYKVRANFGGGNHSDFTYSAPLTLTN